MSEKSRIKNSFAKRKYSESFASQRSMEKSPKCSFFLPICFGIFVGHWIIICPLTFGMLYRTIYSKNWPQYWPQLFWMTALFLYIVTMMIFLILWRRRKAKRGQELGNPEGMALERSKNLKSLDSIEEETDPATLKKPPPPLVIEKEKKTDEEDPIEVRGDSLSRVSQEINRSSIKEYLKIVTVETPSPGKTCGTPMTPRDLFFIDLIKNAEKAEEKGLRAEDSGNVFKYDDVGGESRGDEDEKSESPGGTERKNNEEIPEREDKKAKLVKMSKLESDLIDEMKRKQKSGDFYGLQSRRSESSSKEEIQGTGETSGKEIDRKSESSDGSTDLEDDSPDETGDNEKETPEGEDIREEMERIENLKIVSSKKKIGGEFPEVPEVRPRKPHSSPHRATYGEIAARRNPNFDRDYSTSRGEEDILRNKSDTRRYTLGSAAFKDLLGQSNSRRLSKSETTLPQISEKEETPRNSN